MNRPGLHRAVLFRGAVLSRVRLCQAGGLSQASIQKPAVFPLTCCKNTTDVTTVALGCLVTGYFPGPVTVTWDTGSLNSSTRTFPAVQNLESSLYTTSSQVTILGKWSKQKFTCSVAHPDSNITITKVVPGCFRDFPEPSVKLFHSSCNPDGDTHTTIQLLCLISGYTPGRIQVAWLEDGQAVTDRFPQTANDRPEGKLASTHSQLNITQEEWLSQKTYTCQVTYNGFTYEDHARKCTESDPRGVSAYLIPPTPLDLYVHKSPKITCLVVDLARKEGMNLTWFRENRGPAQPDSLVIKTQFNKTVTATSTLLVDVQDWIEGETYYCKVTHPDLPRSILRSISKAPGKRLAPEVYVLSPRKEERAAKDKLTLTCLAQNFFPEDISVQWLRNKALIQTDQHSTTKPHKANGPSPAFFVYSRLVVSQADWEQKNKFTCRVVHEALPGSRTLEKSVSSDLELGLEDMCAEEAGSEELAATWTSLSIFITLFLLSVSYGATVTLCKVKWVLATVLQEKPQAFHDYTNIMQPAA